MEASESIADQLGLPHFAADEPEPQPEQPPAAEGQLPLKQITYNAFNVQVVDVDVPPGAKVLAVHTPTEVHVFPLGPPLAQDISRRLGSRVIAPSPADIINVGRRSPTFRGV